jgi:3,4-dihydroxy 2-butanone 4-phosphate synthase/GTP cyclohydrolase II
VSSLELSAECFAAGDPVLVGGLGGAGTAVATAAARADADRLGALQGLGGDMVVLGLEAAIAERLDLTAVRRATRRQPGLRLTTPVDAADCSSGGWSLRDRARTIRVAVAPGTPPSALTVPGHVHVGAVEPTGWSAPAIALELARAAGQSAAVLLCAVLDRDGGAVSLQAARRDDRLRRLPAAPVDELCGRAVTRRAELESIRCALPTRLGDFRVAASATADGGEVTVTLVHGDPVSEPEPPVHTHLACLFGDTFGSLLCDCHRRLDHAAAEIRARGCGTLIYVKQTLDDPFVCPRAGAD